MAEEMEAPFSGSHMNGTEAKRFFEKKRSLDGDSAPPTSAKRVRFPRMTRREAIKDIMDTFAKRGKMFSSYGNLETDDMGTHVADLMKKNLFPVDVPWCALILELRQEMDSLDPKTKNAEKNKKFLEDELGGIEHITAPDGQKKAVFGIRMDHRAFREFMTMQTYGIREACAPANLLPLARRIARGINPGIEWKPDDYRLDSSLAMTPARMFAQWFATLCHQIYAPLAEDNWTYNPAIMKDVEKKYEKDEDEDEEEDEEATQPYNPPPRPPLMLVRSMTTRAA